jgi:hypothetical protein
LKWSLLCGRLPILAGAWALIQFGRGLLDQALKDMGAQKNLRNQEIARLQLELASASQRLDELEKRSRLRACQKAELGFIDGTAAGSVAESAELRFAANVASGMTKRQFG